MLCELDATCVLKNQQIERCSVDVCDSQEEGSSLPLKGNLSSSRSHVWLWKGPQLDVWSKNGQEYSSLAAFNFANIFNDRSIYISSVTQLVDSFEVLTSRENSKFRLVVALNRNSAGSLLCVVDPRISKMIKLIESPFKVVCLNSLDAYSSHGRNVLNFAEQLRIMCGIMVAGTENGLVVFIDLCLDVLTLPDLLAPNKVKFVVKQSQNSSKKADITSNRKSALVHGQHIGLPLNSDAHGKGRFIYRAADGSILAKFQNHLISASAIDYIFQTNLLCVGFSFGGFQLWNMNTLLLECSCSLESDLPPVIRFTFQEPENDPKNYCYLWVVRGLDAGIEDTQEIVQPSAAYLFALAFRLKQWVPGFGYLYSEFDTCACRFDYQMTTNSILGPSSVCKSYLISCDTVYQTSQMYQRSYEDEGGCIDTSLCVFAWEAWVESSSNQSCTYFAIFDLNQWYQAQMPPFVDAGYYNSYCPFIGLYTLSNVTNIALPDALLYVKLNPETISAFRARHNYSEINYYPCSLSFDVSVITENRALTVCYQGIQRRCLAEITKTGPSALLEPMEAVRNCVACGLLSGENLQFTVALQREALLNLALENDEIAFIIQIIESWSSGEYNNIGCNCRLILDWIWKNVSQTKANIDKFTEPLFADGEKLDGQKLEQLNSFEVDLKALAVLLKNLELAGGPTTDQGSKELSTRIEVTELISSYLRIVLWFYSCGILPEHLEDEQTAVYPFTAISDTYEVWRKELCSINPDQLKSKDLLMIDAVVDSLENVSSIWKQAGGNGFYPPPSLHSLVGIYLLESCPLDLKHFLVLYFLFDTATYLSESETEIADKIRLFPAAFNLKPGLTKLVQGVWALDHRAYEFAVKTLSDPAVRQTLANDEQTVSYVYSMLQEQILTSLLYQGYPRYAQQYMSLNNLMNLDSPVKEKLRLSVLLSNKEVLQALQLERICRNESNTEELLLHFFLACEQMNLMEEVFKLPLDLVEEDALMYYLLNVSSNPSAKLLLCLYFTSNNKIIDANNFMQSYQASEDLLSDQILIRCQQLAEYISSHVAALPRTLTALATDVAASRELRKDSDRINSKFAPIQLKPSTPHRIISGASEAIRSVLEQLEGADEEVRKNNPTKTNSMTPFRKRLTHHGILAAQKSPFLRPAMMEARLARSMNRSGAAEAAYAVSETIFAESCVEEFIPNKRSKATELSFERNKDLYSVLATPPVPRMPSSRVKKSQMRPSMCFTPTSILKNHNESHTSSPSSMSALSDANKTKKCDSVRNRLRFSIPKTSFTPNERKESVEPSKKSVKTVRMSPMETEEEPPKEEISQETIMETNEDHFTFSPPIDRNDSRGQRYEQRTPINASFVFSPPLTRSRARARESTSAEALSASEKVKKESKKEQASTKPSEATTPRRTPSHRMQLRTSSTKKIPKSKQ